MGKLILVLGAATCGWASAGSQIDPQDIIRKSLTVMREDWRQAPSYSHLERQVESRRGSTAKIKTFEVLMIEGSPYRRLVAIEDMPLPLGLKFDEDRKMQHEIDKRLGESRRERDRRIAKYVRDRDRGPDMLAEMLNAFDFRLSGEERINGHPCWILDATPKAGYVPKNREAKVLTGMNGRLWIEKSNNQWVKAQAEVIHPVSFFGFLAKVGPGTKFVLEQAPVTSTLWFPKRFNIQVNASALGFLNEDFTNDETYHEYRPMTEAVASLQSTK